jgi:peptidoglycan/xylan/chitin deacetylase (PgdA/CDA1 family)
LFLPALVLVSSLILAKEYSARALLETLSSPGMRSLIETEQAAKLEAPQVALTFDDGPNAIYTPQLLDGLKERDVHATFFLMGENIEGQEELVKRMQQEGHLIGNHTYSHVQLNQIARETAKQEVEKTSNLIYEITGVYPVYLRPPYGAWPKNLDFAVEMIPVFWSVDTLDWESRSVSAIMRIVNDEVEDGSIILMHDAYPTSVEAAFQIVDQLKAQGYVFVTVEELLLL